METTYCKNKLTSEYTSFSLMSYLAKSTVQKLNCFAATDEVINL